MNQKSKIIWQINYTDSPYAFDPGGLKLSEVEENRRQARKNNIDYDTYEKVKHLKTGVSWNYKKSENSFFDSYFFYQKRDFYSKLPFNFGGVIEIDRDYYGFGTKFTRNKNFDNRNNSFVIGIDHLSQSDDRKRFKNNFGLKGDVTLSQMEKFDTTGLYILNQTTFNTGFLFRYGIRYDINSIGIDSNNKINLDKINPSLGLSYTINSSDNLFFSFAIFNSNC